MRTLYLHRINITSLYSIPPHHVTSRHVTSRHITSRHITSHRVTSYHIIHTCIVPEMRQRGSYSSIVGQLVRDCLHFHQSLLCLETVHISPSHYHLSLTSFPPLSTLFVIYISSSSSSPLLVTSFGYKETFPIVMTYYFKLPVSSLFWLTHFSSPLSPFVTSESKESKSIGKRVERPVANDDR